MIDYWSGDEWRWRLRSEGFAPTIDVIEPVEEREQPRSVRRVPFGFARALSVEVAEPLRWEGDDS